MASMNISVPDPMREWVERRIGTGQYASVSDYVRDLIRRDQTQMATDQQDKLRALRTMVEASISDPRPGVSADDVDARLDQRAKSYSAHGDHA